jgi:hypothetical protein
MSSAVHLSSTAGDVRRASFWLDLVVLLCGVGLIVASVALFMQAA